MGSAVLPRAWGRAGAVGRPLSPRACHQQPCPAWGRGTSGREPGPLLLSGPGWAVSLLWVPPPLQLVLPGLLLAEDPAPRVGSGPRVSLAAVAVRCVHPSACDLRVLPDGPRLGLWVSPCSSEEQLPLGKGSMQRVGGMQAPLAAWAARGLKLLLLPSQVSLL